MDNQFAGLPEGAGAESFTELELRSRPGLRIERIVSAGKATPPGSCYDQPQCEWVLSLQGEAKLGFESEPVPRLLKPGDFIDIARHHRHRVEWTHPSTPTVWLVVQNA